MSFASIRISVLAFSNGPLRVDFSKFKNRAGALCDDGEVTALMRVVQEFLARVEGDRLGDADCDPLARPLRDETPAPPDRAAAKRASQTSWC
jgi:hypothetical protein